MKSLSDFTGIIILALVILPLHVFAQNAKQSPNIIYIMTDDQGYGDVGYMGHPYIKTPNIDQMAQNGIRLDRFYTASPVCTPTRASVLTGRSPSRMGSFSWGHALRPQEQTIISFMKDAGYQTGFFGKWHLGSVRAGEPTSPGANGFDVWYAAPNFYENDPWMSRNGDPVQLKGESSVITAEIAMEFIESAVIENDPFVAFIWLGSPHVPHEAVPELLDLYPGHPENMQNYYGEMSGIDNAVGHVRERLRELNIAENTLLLYTSDNGGRFPEGDNGDLRGQKGDLWEGGIRVPSVFEWPGQIKHRISHIPASTVDLFPTFMELAGFDPEKHTRPLDGISLLPLLKGDVDHREQPLGFWHLGVIGGQGMNSPQIMQDLQQFQAGTFPEEDLNEGLLNTPGLPYEGVEQYPDPAAWMDGDWKLHRTDSGYELYNLANDQAEEHDILDQHPERASHMQKELQKWQDSVINSLRGKDY